MLATRLDVIGSNNLLLVFLCPQRHYGGLESCHEAEEEEARSPSTQPCTAAPRLATEQIICLRTGEEDPAMDAFRFGFDPNWPQAFKPWGSAR